MMKKQKIREELLQFLLCYSEVTCAAIADKVKQLGLIFQKMHDNGVVNMAGKTNGMAVLMLTY